MRLCHQERLLLAGPLEPLQLSRAELAQPVGAEADPFELVDSGNPAVRIGMLDLGLQDPLQKNAQ